ncbi:MAG: hypothetical protein WAU33_04975 [Candidatus Binataceae bacterium]
MSSQADAVIAAELQPGEEMLWCAQPDGTSRFFIRIGVVALCIVAAIGVHGITDTTAFRLAMPFGLKPGSAALWALAALILVDSILFGAYTVNTYYGLTNRRVIIVSNLPRHSVRDFALDDFRDAKLGFTRLGTTVEIYRGSPGTFFSNNLMLFANPSIQRSLTSGVEHYFLVGIPDAGIVEQALRDATSGIPATPFATPS